MHHSAIADIFGISYLIRVTIAIIFTDDVMNIDGLLSDEETPTSSDSARSSVSDIGSADNCFWFDLLSAYNGRGDRADPSTWPEVVLFEGWMLGFKPAPADAVKAIDPQTEVAMREAGNPGMTDEEVHIVIFIFLQLFLIVYDVMNIDGLLSDEETPTSSDSARSSVSDIGSADYCFWFDLL
ncbi:hypothetical protein Tco_0949534, partial [Tanacetum coccineum]